VRRVGHVQYVGKKRDEYGVLLRFIWLRIRQEVGCFEHSNYALNLIKFREFLGRLKTY